MVGREPEAQFGAGVSGVGDVNGDGFDDVIIPLPFAKPGGSAALYLGSPHGLSSEPTWTYACTNAGAYFGPSASALDINQDGFDDVLIGAQTFSGVKEQQGRVYLFLGGPDGLSSAPAWTCDGESERARLGASFEGVGDVNGDGLGDVLVGVSYEVSLEGKGGHAFLFLGSSNGLASFPAWSTAGRSEPSLLGSSLSGAGDVNGDGYDDLIISAPAVHAGHEAAGELYVYYGGPKGPGPLPNWTIQGTRAYEGLATRVSRAGDVNGDGFSDISFSVNYSTIDQDTEGVVFVFYGGPGGPSLKPGWFAEGNAVKLRFGWPTFGGDINGDGMDDFMVGVPYARHTLEDEGTAVLYLGSPNGLGRLPTWSGESGDAFSYYGAHVRSAGDVNGDGYDDIVVGEQPYTHGTGRPGRAYIYYGSKIGLRNDTGWRPVADKFGFTWKSVALPFPNLAWIGLVASLVGGGAIWLALVYRSLNRTRAALVAETTARALDQQRARIARDLHDNLGTYLARINVASEIAKSQMPDSGTASAQLDNIVRNARTAATVLSEVAWANDPQGDTLDNLLGYLTDFANRFAQEAPFECELDFPPSTKADPLPNGFRQNVFLTFKEALTNALRHSKATRLSIRVQLNETTLAIIIEDNGCGFQADQVPNGHNGLRHMRQRMADIGGTVELICAPGKGTALRLSVDLPNQ